MKKLRLLTIILNKFIFRLPVSIFLRYFWNFGRFLFFVLIIQLFTGIFLLFYYTNEGFIAFDSVQYIIYNVHFGWLFRLIHFNGASLIFLILFLHILKGLFFIRFRLTYVWFFGIILFLIFIIEAFLGYVLVWSQIRYWAAVVITRLLSVIPYLGRNLVCWIWGGFVVINSTLKFFIVLHFLIPFISFIFIFFHLYCLHIYGSSRILFVSSLTEKIRFFPFFWVKDLINIFWIFIFIFFSLNISFYLGDLELFLEADYINRPIHIVPEWYYLFAYAILRSIYNKILGVIILIIRILILFFFCFFKNYLLILDLLNKLFLFNFLFIFIYLRWIGQCMLEYPFIDLGFYFFILYFFFIILILFFFYYSLKFFIN